MTMRYAHLSPGYLSTEIGLLENVSDGDDKNDPNQRDLKRAKKRAKCRHAPPEGIEDSRIS
jgi:hypothetical protein